MFQYKADLGSAGATKRPTSCILITSGKNFDSQDLLDEIKKEIISITPAF